MESIVVEAWNTVLYEKFRRFKHIVVNGLSRHSDVALARARYCVGERVLDVGCGFGDTTLEIAGLVGSQGQAVGVDCAAQFIGDARAAACTAGIANARFMVGDVHRAKLEGPYDHAFARFGTMFFDMPGVAMRNIRKALKPGGDFTQIVWRRREDNPWVYDAEQCVKQIVPVVSHEETDQVHCGPGPFSMAAADMVSAMLHSAGFDRVTFERHDCDICIGIDLDEAIQVTMALGPAGEIIRLAGEEGEVHQDEVTEALREVLSPYVRAEGVWAPSSAWIVRSENPA